MVLYEKKTIIIGISAVAVIVTSLFVWNFATKAPQNMSEQNNQSTVLPVDLAAKEKIYKELTGNLGEAISDSENEKLQELIKDIVEIENNGNDKDKKSAVYKDIIAILDDVTLRSTDPEDLEKYKEYYSKYNSYINSPGATEKLLSGNKYVIKEDGTISPEVNNMNSAAVRLDEEIWERVKKIIPFELLMGIKYFETFEADLSTGAATSGFIKQEFRKTLLEFTLGININEPQEELSGTLIHEYGHYLSEKDANIEPDSDGKHAVYNGGGILEKFVKECLGHIEEELNNADRDKLYLFYARHKDDFVTKYAATDFFEDFAESFAYFVKGSEFESETLKRKMKFFNDNEELLTIKTKILKNMEDNNMGEIIRVTE